MTPMSHRERVLKVLNNEASDRVPLDLGNHPHWVLEAPYMREKYQ